MADVKWPRRFKETSHQHSAEGWCWGLGFDKKGPIALVEYSRGEVRCLRLNTVYDIHFIEPLGHG